MAKNNNIRSVAHQGFSTTAQYYGNSRISSYVGAAQMGFDYGETIATLDEVLFTCKTLGLGLYIDHLSPEWDDAKWETILCR